MPTSPGLTVGVSSELGQPDKHYGLYHSHARRGGGSDSPQGTGFFVRRAHASQAEVRCPLCGCTSGSAVGELYRVGKELRRLVGPRGP
ncbi:hypothetical protein NDU88_003061 [Pleurodeles waltl]|uniref:Uncharacterized protein n=1 Tax=Pleurodeles waltl TaxID=8319 RepID=A0AAV7MQK0_PLEWA|nr:hypothetical protein NDU88_003061 [Pleurodeles waltl]